LIGSVLCSLSLSSSPSLSLSLPLPFSSSTIATVCYGPLHTFSLHIP
jgi:hypothetical protein